MILKTIVKEKAYMRDKRAFDDCLRPRFSRIHPPIEIGGLLRFAAM